MRESAKRHTRHKNRALSAVSYPPNGPSPAHPIATPRTTPSLHRNHTEAIRQHDAPSGMSYSVMPRPDAHLAMRKVCDGTMHLRNAPGRMPTGAGAWLRSWCCSRVHPTMSQYTWQSGRAVGLLGPHRAAIGKAGRNHLQLSSIFSGLSVSIGSASSDFVPAAAFSASVDACSARKKGSTPRPVGLRRISCIRPKASPW